MKNASGPLRSGPDVTAISLAVIAVVATIAAAWFAQDILAPIVLALVAGIILSPLNDVLDRLGLPNSISALLSFLAGLLMIGVLILIFEPIVTRGVDAMPSVWSELNSVFYQIQSELRGLERISENVARAVGSGGNGGGNGGNGGALPTVGDVIVMAPAIVGQIAIFMGALFFFILTRREIYDWAARRLSGGAAREDVALRLRMAERQVSAYFLTISIINLGLGFTVGAVMAAIGMPTPFIWGILAFFLNYFLYVGPVALVVVLTVAGIATFDGWAVMLPPAAYLFCNFIEAQFVTPALLGRRMQVNPLLIFLSLVFLMWLWGPIGGIVSIPLLLWGLVLTKDIRALRAEEAARIEAELAAKEPAEEAVEPRAAAAR